MTGSAPSSSSSDKRGAGIEVAPPVLAVFERQQNLGHGDAGGCEQLLIDVCQRNLAHGRGGLGLRQLPADRPAASVRAGPARWRPEDTSTTSCPRARRRSRSSTRVSSQGRLTCPSLIDQQRRADLDDDPACTS